MKKKSLKVKIEDFGTLTLENVGGGNYDVFKSNGICIGTINPNDYDEEWEGDTLILANIIEEAIDNGDIGDCFGDYEDEDDY